LSSRRREARKPTFATPDAAGVCANDHNGAPSQPRGDDGESKKIERVGWKNRLALRRGNYHSGGQRKWARGGADRAESKPPGYVPAQKEK